MQLTLRKSFSCDLTNSKPSGEGLHQTKVHRTIARNTPGDFRGLKPTIHHLENTRTLPILPLFSLAGRSGSLDPPDPTSEHVLRRIALKGQTLQYSLVRGIEHIDLLRTLCLFRQRNQLALHLNPSRVASIQLSEGHDVLAALHAVQHFIIAFGQQRVPTRVGSVNVTLLLSATPSSFWLAVANRVNPRTHTKITAASLIKYIRPPF